jgi:hypothetical protein
MAAPAKTIRVGQGASEELDSEADRGVRRMGRRPKTFSGLGLSLRETRARLAELEAQQKDREQRLAEVLGRRVIAEASQDNTQVDTLKWIKRQLADDNSFGSDEREIVEDFLSSLESKGAEHG